ncbi:MAG: DUF1002 domain-containing protein [Ruminococcaceae bacterium]|nr:DUF1002 domain-containing protein [Oscillospiraceae bacterium]
MRFKRITAALLAICMLAGFTTAFAAHEGEERTVIGVDISQSQVEEVYEDFGIERGDVTELTVTNDEEREYLEGLVDNSVIGSRSISCVYIKVMEEGEGLDVTAHNINWCTEEIYANALVTAGITDAEIIVTAPFTVSGTAALTGIYKAYEDITGEELDETAKEVGTEEMVITSELAEQIGNYDATILVNELKLMLDELENYTDEELYDEIVRIAGEYGITLTDDQINQLIKLARGLQKMDNSELLENVQNIQGKLKDLAGILENADNSAEGIRAFFANIGDFFKSIGDFFKRIING